MAQAHAAPFGALRPADARRQFRRHHAVVGGFEGQAADRRKADVDAGGRQSLGL